MQKKFEDINLINRRWRTRNLNRMTPTYLRLVRVILAATWIMGISEHASMNPMALLDKQVKKSMARSIRQGESNNMNQILAPLIVLRNITSRFLSGMWIFKILHRNLHTLRCTCSQRSTKACNNLSHPSSPSVKPQTRHQM